MDEKNKQIQIKAKDEDLKGVYSNLMMLSHTKEEFCLDFINTFNPPTLTSRVLMSPAHLKRMANVLVQSLKKYEEQFGIIILTEEPKKEIGFKS